MATFTDTFTRADENPLASPWETLSATGLRIISNVAKGGASAFCLSGYLESVTNFGDNQYCQAVIASIGGSDNAGVGVRCVSTAGGAGYIAYFSEEGASDRVYLRKFVAGVPTSLLTPVTTIANGDTLKVSVETSGSDAVISVTVNDVHITGSPYTDTVAALTGGQPALYYDNGNTNATTIDTVEGGDIAAAGSNVNILSGKLAGLLGGKL